jgi:hypothetical protein
MSADGWRLRWSVGSDVRLNHGVWSRMATVAARR